MLHGKRILLIISGGIAAYKSLELIRRLRERGVGVRAILTHGGAQFVTPLAVSSLTRERVFSDLFSLTDEAEIGHIELSRSADLVVVAPATADIMAKMATGQADDLATTALLATDKPVLIAPAMNVRMWNHPATQRNLAILRQSNIAVVGPNDGDMACGEYGPGRLAEPEEIITAIEKLLSAGGKLPLKERKVIITAGPTHEPIDPVRYIANRSSGRQGYALAAAAVHRGAETILISGPTNLPVPSGVQIVAVETAEDMRRAVERELPADIAIFAAAVADWRISNISHQKIKKSTAGKVPSLQLSENPDILASVARHTRRPRLVVGFAAETENVVEQGKDKLRKKGADIIIANDVGAKTGVLGGDRNRVHVISAEGVDSWPDLSKEEVASRLMDRFAQSLGSIRKAAE
ncbi:MAG TPA: bifunctional phosphopantothenoylcysteine decarboxylase/phosphopantothenate--cysteine ligase CoaBC [Aestuariivirgaceae bacterium]|nr:bifunctional phosphopantothenoylcysteine decarboxylase/phosphopantothenate--cysteine ligase CoaBC [Aestuariivirgaceae bacterium]